MKRKWTRAEKLLWLAPLIFLVCAGAAVWGPEVVRRQLGRPLLVEVPPNVSVQSITLSSDGSTLVATGQFPSRRTPRGRVYVRGRVYAWNARDLKPLATWNVGKRADDVAALGVSPQGDRMSWSALVSAGPSYFGVYDRATQRALWQMNGNFFASDAEFSPDGKTVAVARNTKEGMEYLLLRVADGKITSRWDSIEYATQHSLLSWAPDGKTLASQVVTASPKSRRNTVSFLSFQIQIRRANDGQLLRRWSSSPLQALDFSPDGQTLVTVSYRPEPPKPGSTLPHVTALHASTGRELWRYETAADKDKDGQTTPFAFCDGQFSPDGKLVAALSRFPGQVLLLDAQTGALKRTLSLGDQTTNSYRPNALAWAPDSKRLYARGQDAVLVWDLD